MALIRRTFFCFCSAHGLYINVVRNEMKNVYPLLIIVLFIGCESKTQEKPFSHFGQHYHLDSIAGQDNFEDPMFITLTKDSVIQMLARHGYSSNYDTDLRITKSLQVLTHGQVTHQLSLTERGIWLEFLNQRRFHYELGYGKYDSVYKHFRIMKTHEDMLRGKWTIDFTKTEADDILRCELTQSSIINFTEGKFKNKVVIITNTVDNKMDTCLRRSFYLNGSDILINDYDTFPPYKIIELNDTILTIQDWRRLIYLKKAS
jgi:hypothetical protein